jgi:predicted RNase H-like nuclease
VSRDRGKLAVAVFSGMRELLAAHPDDDRIFVDVAIGLP